MRLFQKCADINDNSADKTKNLGRFHTHGVGKPLRHNQPWNQGQKLNARENLGTNDLIVMVLALLGIKLHLVSAALPIKFSAEP